MRLWTFTFKRSSIFGRCVVRVQRVAEVPLDHTHHALDLRPLAMRFALVAPTLRPMPQPAASAARGLDRQHLARAVVGVQLAVAAAERVVLVQPVAIAVVAIGEANHGARAVCPGLTRHPPEAIQGGALIASVIDIGVNETKSHTLSTGIDRRLRHLFRSQTISSDPNAIHLSP